MKSEYRLKVLERIKEYERQGLWDKDVEDDPETVVLLPDKVDYLGEKFSSKIKTFFVNRIATAYYEKQIKKKNFIIKDIIGLENFNAVKGGAIITCNHFHPNDNYLVWRAIKKDMGGRLLYKVIREGNYTNYKGLFGVMFRNCNTLPLSSNMQTMRKFLDAVSTLLHRGDKILIYPEQGMWWNYRKPRPMKNGAFNLASTNGVPVIPMFITMEDDERFDGEGFNVQAYTLHILPAIYPNGALSVKENTRILNEKNYSAWKEVYEKFYSVPLVYGD